MIRKTHKLLSVLLCAAVLISCFTVPALAVKPQISNISEKDGIITALFDGGVSGTADIKIYNGGSLVYTASKEASGSAVQFALPVRSVPYGQYQVAVSVTNSEGVSTQSSTVTFGSGSPVYTAGTQYAASSGGSTTLMANMQTPGFCRAVMVPYATVYADSGMGMKKAELKRLDIVNVLSINDTIAHVQYTIQSGNGTSTKVDNINAEYQSDDDILGTGYMYTSAFQTTAISDKDKQREVVELAYARLGLKGVYSQAKRYIGFYTDCSALASWCWYMAGIDFGSWTSCTGIWNWAKGITDKTVIVWDAEADPSIAAADIATYRAGNSHGEDEPCDCTYSFVDSSGNTYTESEITSYKKQFVFDIFNDMEPGDIILFNYVKELTETSHNGVFAYPIDEADSGVQLGGYDHAAIFIGVEDNNAMFIEATGPENNTVVTTVGPSTPKIRNIAAIIRPVGGTVIDKGVMSLYNYIGADYIEFNGSGELSFPFAPEASYRVSSPYGWRDCPFHGWEFHPAVDLAAVQGTPIYAAHDGTVLTGYAPNGYGNYVYVNRGDGLQTRYAHMSRIAVPAGASVTAGQLIGFVGSTGSSTGPHLHFEVRWSNQAVNPMLYF